MFFKNFKVWETELAAEASIETGKWQGLANAADYGSLRRHKRTLHSYGFS